MAKIVLQTLLSGIAGAAFFGVLLFVPAGTVNYWQAWLFIAVFLIGTLVPSFYLAVTDPATLRRRMNAGPAAETRIVQKFAITGTVLLVVAVTVVSALDHRFGWSSVATGVVITGDVLVAAGLVLTQLVILQNRYAAANVTVEAEQTLVSTGLYGVVRHPMYTAALIVMIGMPLALDSYWGLGALLLGAPVLVARVVDEEKMLREELDGYQEYTHTVRYRVIPHVW